MNKPVDGQSSPESQRYTLDQFIDDHIRRGFQNNGRLFFSRRLTRTNSTRSFSFKSQLSILESSDETRFGLFVCKIITGNEPQNFSLQSIDFENEEDLFEEEISSIYETDIEEDEILLSESSDNQSFLLDENNQSHGS